MQKVTLEVWKAIRDYEGLYEVSNWARVRSVERDVWTRNQYRKCVKHYKEKILRPAPNGDGYLTVVLSKDGVEETKSVHVLVADAFIENPNNYEHVHHRNHIQTDNSIENLEWISKEEHRKLHGTEQSKTVYQYTLDGFLVNVWESIMEVTRQLGFNQSCICECCNGKRKTHKGYIWSYEPL